MWKWNSTMSIDKYQSGLFNDQCPLLFFLFNPPIIFGRCLFGNVRSWISGDYSFLDLDQSSFLADIDHLNRTTVWKVMTIWISRELPLFNSDLFDILSAGIGPPCDKLWPFEFLESFRCSISSVSIYYTPESDLRVKCYDHLNFLRASVVQFRASRYIMLLNRTSERKVMTIWISRELPLHNFKGLALLLSWHALPCE